MKIHLIAVRIANIFKLTYRPEDIYAVFWLKTQFISFQGNNLHLNDRREFLYDGSAGYTSLYSATTWFTNSKVPIFLDSCIRAVLQ